MQRLCLFRKKRKFFVLNLLFLIMCVLTFICVSPDQVNASSELTIGEDGDDEGNETGADNAVLEDNGLEIAIGDLNLSLTSENASSSLSATLQMLLLLTVITLAPSILIMVTSFTRILIVLHFARTAIGTQSSPPNQILIGLSLFLTLFLMYPTFAEVNEAAIQPLSRGEISQEEAFDRGVQPIRTFMIGQLTVSDNTSDLELFLRIANIQEPVSPDEVPLTVLIPVFILNELRAAFIAGFFLYIPFIIIDMVVASTLMSMGMMMLPPTTISMPFKILLFVMADGWSLVIGEVVRTIADGIG